MFQIGGHDTFKTETDTSQMIYKSFGVQFGPGNSFKQCSTAVPGTWSFTGFFVSIAYSNLTMLLMVRQG